MKTSLARCLSGLLITLFLPRIAFGGGTVNSADEASLRAALAGGGTVTFNCDGTIVLTGTLAIVSSTVMDATGHAITLSGCNAVRLFSVSSGVSASFINLTLANGCAKGADGTGTTDGQPGIGGAILNNGGTVSLTGCLVVSNTAVGGAGYTNCTWPTNSAGGAALGGAVYNLAGNLFVTNCGFSANGATGGIGGRNIDGCAGGDACGGAIYSQGGSMTVWGSTFASQKARGQIPGSGSMSQASGSGSGGAIWTSNVVVNLFQSAFGGNSAAGADSPLVGAQAGSAKGGAVFANSGTANCAGCTFTGNTVVAGYKTKNGIVGLAQGGAIWSVATLSVAESSFLGNTAIGRETGDIGVGAGEGSGGAIFNGNTLALSGCTLANNTVHGGDGGVRGSVWNCPGGIGRGGAVCSLGTLAATNCTFAMNSATGGTGGNTGSSESVSGGAGAGGGVCISAGTAALVNLTFASNNATGGAGGGGGPAGASAGGAICNSNGTVNPYNTIVAYSISGSNCWGTFFDYGHNLSSDNSAGFYAAGSLNNTDPVLGPLDDYGGPTLTMALLTGSPAIDGGSTALAPATDQRGRSRPYGSAADIGAFESSAPFIVKGNLVGATGVVTFSAGTTNVAATNWGTYWFRTLAAGSCVITPSNANYIFVPDSRSYTLGPDQLHADFKAYGWNTVNTESISNGMLQLRYAGTNGQTYRILSATGLFGSWLPVTTNYLSASNYFDVFLPLTTEPTRYYRAVSP